MTTVDQLWQMAHDLYARARASIDPSTKRMLIRWADDLLRQADELRRGHIVQSALPKPDRKIGCGPAKDHAGTLQRALQRNPIERDFPHTVEILVPPGGFGSKLDAMYAFHAQHGIKLGLALAPRDEPEEELPEEPREDDAGPRY